MGKLVVAVMPPPSAKDLAGEAYLARLHAAGFTQFNGVRLGRRFALRVDGPVTPEHIDAAREAAVKFLIEPGREEIVRIFSTDSDESTVPWDDFEEVWGGDASGEFAGLSTTGLIRNPEAHGHDISEASLGHVESASIAAYWDDNDDFEEPG